MWSFKLCNREIVIFLLVIRAGGRSRRCQRRRSPTRSRGSSAFEGGLDVCCTISLRDSTVSATVSKNRGGQTGGTFLWHFRADGLLNAGDLQGVQFPAMPMLARRHFGIRESAFVLLHFFDMSSYAARKNPAAVQALFDRLRAENPFADLQLVLKVKEREAESDWGAVFADDPQIKVLSTPLDTQGVLSLINACDCFVSLHRSEGFGRGMAEAMALGRLALGTAWSGNLDFMRAENSLLVRADTIAVGADEYPHGVGQHWADPDLDHAHDLLRPVLADPTRGRTIAERGRRDILQSHGNRALGLRILDRVEAILAPLVKARKGRKK